MKNFWVGQLKVRNFFIVLEIQHEIGKYYRSLFLKTFGIKLQRPSNSEHITVVSDYDKTNISNYRYLDKTIIPFDTDPFLYWNGNAVWVNIHSKELDEIREIIGLGKPIYDFHFCIGYFE